MNPSFKKPLIVAAFGLFFLRISIGPITALIGIALLLWAAWGLFRAFRPTSSAARSVADEVRGALDPLQYKSIHNNTGIGIDPEKD